MVLYLNDNETVILCPRQCGFLTTTRGSFRSGLTAPFTILHFFLDKTNSLGYNWGMVTETGSALDSQCRSAVSPWSNAAGRQTVPLALRLYVRSGESAQT